MSQCYYVDPSLGQDSNSGLSPEAPKKDYRAVSLLPGDSLLFKRGTVTRDFLLLTDGDSGNPITYGAYGDGDAPTFLGSADLSGESAWKHEGGNLWSYAGVLPSEACNLIFDDGNSFGNLRWELSDLRRQGEWHYTHLGIAGNSVKPEEITAPEKLYLYSEKNPGAFYRQIECALWSVNGMERRLAYGQHDIILQDLCFKNGGVHGFQAIRPYNLTIRRCGFINIGGATYDRKLRIRLGNGVEFWDSADDIQVTGCSFYEIYDSCVTHQGGKECLPARRVSFRDNLFVKYGMAAYECRDRLPIETHFDDNICARASGGFAMQGEEPPRQSEIYPEPMGHHLFLWRIEQPSPGGSLSIRRNIFFESPFGAALYSIIAPEAAAQMEMDDNCYYKSSDGLFWHINGKSYDFGQFAAYQKESGQDSHSFIADPRFAGEEDGDYSMPSDSLCKRLGVGGSMERLPRQCFPNHNR